MKLALKGVLVAPDFLFRIEQPPSGPGIHALNGYELAARLSYFPGDHARRGADQVGARRLRRIRPHGPGGTHGRSQPEAFTEAFIGQWLGTKDVGKVAPTVNEIQTFYSPEVAAEAPSPSSTSATVAREPSGVLDLLDSDYTFLTKGSRQS